MKQNECFRKGNLLEITIEKIVAGGEGLGYSDQTAVFVPMSVPGDYLQIQIISVKKNYVRGLIRKILIPSGERAKDSDKISFEDYQGCDFAMMLYPAQLKYKKNIIEEVLKKIGKISGIWVDDVVPSPEIYHYRNKIIEPFRLQDDRIISGFFRRRSHDVFEVSENMLNSKLGNRIIRKLKRLLNAEKISVYNEIAHSGLLRNIMIRTNSFGEAMVVLILNSNQREKSLENILLRLKDSMQEIRSVYLSCNPERTNVALGKHNILLWGTKTIREQIQDLRFHISPLSFFQINLPQAAHLYERAIGLFSNIRGRTIIDAFSGTGTIAMLLAKHAKKVYAIESIKAAVEDGIKTANENQIHNIEFIVGKVENTIAQLLGRGERIDGIIVDPPRKGIEKNVLLAFKKHKISEIIYISCDPATFARDLGILISLGFQTDQIMPFDMFPNTSHVECVTKLSLTSEHT
jgi:23S rRNA (uracil1939-C5)-methyltransferase